MNQSLRASAYLRTLPPAIAGQGGHAATFNAACRLVEFGLAFDEALGVLLAWNLTHCAPTWTESELRHKLTDAFKKAGPLKCFTSGISQRRKCDAPGSRPVTVPGFPAATSKLTRSDRFQLAMSKRALMAGTDAEHRALASLRGIYVEAVALASERGLVRFGNYRDVPAWFVCDSARRMAQARRMDGSPWFDCHKALTVTGGQAQWPLGIIEAKPFQTIALCEGGPDLLAAFHFVIREGRKLDCSPVAIMGRGNIHPEALPLFTGKRVRIFMHADESGEGAAKRWFNQLEGVRASVDGFAFEGLRRTDGKPVKDLNDFVTVNPSDLQKLESSNILP